MSEQEYTDGYQQEHPELIPKNPDEALSWLESAIKKGITLCDTQTFLRAWWAFGWLNPGFHPDDYDQWPDLQYAKELAEEAIDRAKAGEIDDDSEFYAAEATHNAVWLEIINSPNAPPKKPSYYVICQHPDKPGATGYLAADYHPSTGVRLILTGIPALRYAYETREDAEKAATQANLPHTIHQGNTKVELDCPRMLVIQPRCN